MTDSGVIYFIWGVFYTADRGDLYGLGLSWVSTGKAATFFIGLELLDATSFFLGASGFLDVDLDVFLVIASDWAADCLVTII